MNTLGSLRTFDLDLVINNPTPGGSMPTGLGIVAGSISIIPSSSPSSPSPPTPPALSITGSGYTIEGSGITLGSNDQLVFDYTYTIPCDFVPPITSVTAVGTIHDEITLTDPGTSTPLITSTVVRNVSIARLSILSAGISHSDNLAIHTCFTTTPIERTYWYRFNTTDALPANIRIKYTDINTSTVPCAGYTVTEVNFYSSPSIISPSLTSLLTSATPLTPGHGLLTSVPSTTTSDEIDVTLNDGYYLVVKEKIVLESMCFADCGGAVNSDIYLDYKCVSPTPYCTNTHTVYQPYINPATSCVPTARFLKLPTSTPLSAEQCFNSPPLPPPTSIPAIISGTSSYGWNQREFSFDPIYIRETTSPSFSSSPGPLTNLNIEFSTISGLPSSEIVLDNGNFYQVDFYPISSRKSAPTATITREFLSTTDISYKCTKDLLPSATVSPLTSSVVLTSTSYSPSAPFTINIPASGSASGETNNPIKSILFQMTNLLPGERLVFRYRTFRCCPSDTVAPVFNADKNIDNWRFIGATMDGSVKTPSPGCDQCGVYLRSFPTSPSGDAPVSLNLSVGSIQPHNLLDGIEGGTCNPNDPDAYAFKIPISNFCSTETSDKLATIFTNSSSPHSLLGELKVIINTECGLNPFASSSTQITLSNNSPAFGSWSITGGIIGGTAGSSSGPGSVEVVFDLDAIKSVSSSCTLCPSTLSAIEKFRCLLRNSSLNFKIAACCPSCPSVPKPMIRAEFYIKPTGLEGTGASCTDCWIPLAKVEHGVQILCPGCVVPGVIAEDVYVRRTTIGYKDSDNDGLADIGLPFYSNIEELRAISGTDADHKFIVKDEIALDCHAYAQDGDDTDPHNPGFNYEQLKCYWENGCAGFSSASCPTATSSNLSFGYLNIQLVSPCMNASSFNWVAKSANLLWDRGGTVDIDHGVPSTYPMGFINILPFLVKSGNSYMAQIPYSHFIDSPFPTGMITMNDRYRLETLFDVECNGLASECEISVRFWYSKGAPVAPVTGHTAWDNYPHAIDVVTDLNITHPGIPLIDKLCAMNDNTLFVCEATGDIMTGYHIKNAYKSTWNDDIDPEDVTGIGRKSCSKILQNEIQQFLEGPSTPAGPTVIYRNYFPFEYRVLPLNLEELIHGPNEPYLSLSCNDYSYSSSSPEITSKPYYVTGSRPVVFDPSLSSSSSSSIRTMPSTISSTTSPITILIDKSIDPMQPLEELGGSGVTTGTSSYPAFIPGDELNYFTLNHKFEKVACCTEPVCTTNIDGNSLFVPDLDCYSTGLTRDVTVLTNPASSTKLLTCPNPIMNVDLIDPATGVAFPVYEIGGSRFTIRVSTPSPNDWVENGYLFIPNSMGECDPRGVTVTNCSTCTTPCTGCTTTSLTSPNAFGSTPGFLVQFPQFGQGEDFYVNITMCWETCDDEILEFKYGHGCKEGNFYDHSTLCEINSQDITVNKLEIITEAETSLPISVPVCSTATTTATLIVKPTTNLTVMSVTLKIPESVNISSISYSTGTSSVTPTTVSTSTSGGFTIATYDLCPAVPGCVLGAPSTTLPDELLITLHIGYTACTPLTFQPSFTFNFKKFCDETIRNIELVGKDVTFESESTCSPNLSVSDIIEGECDGSFTIDWTGDFDASTVVGANTLRLSSTAGYLEVISITSTTASHTFVSVPPGVYTIELTDQRGCKTTTTHTVRVLHPVDIPIVVDASHTTCIAIDPTIGSIGGVFIELNLIDPGSSAVLVSCDNIITPPTPISPTSMGGSVRFEWVPANTSISNITIEVTNSYGCTETFNYHIDACCEPEGVQGLGWTQANMMIDESLSDFMLRNGYTTYVDLPDFVSVSGNVTFNSFAPGPMPDVVFIMQKMARIYIDPSFNNTEIVDCGFYPCNDLWDQIHVLPGATLHTKTDLLSIFPTRMIITGADIGIFCDVGANVNIDNTIFNRNVIDMQVEGSGGIASSGLVSNSQFLNVETSMDFTTSYTGPILPGADLLPNRLGAKRTLHGIVENNVGTLWIMNSVFDRLQNGIRSDFSSALVYDCNFKDISCTDATRSLPDLPVTYCSPSYAVGDAIAYFNPSGTASGLTVLNSIFENIHGTAIRLSGTDFSSILYDNTMINVGVGINSSQLLKDPATPDKPFHDMKNNNINHIGGGILLDLMGEIELNIERNNIECAAVPGYFANLYPAGIRLTGSPGAPNPTFHIHNNTLLSGKYGIYLSDISGSFEVNNRIENNNIDVGFKPAGYNYNGIRMNNIDGIEVFTNTITGSYAFNPSDPPGIFLPNESGIGMLNSHAWNLACNNINNTNYAIHANGNSISKNSLGGNRIDNAFAGIYLDGSATTDIGDQLEYGASNFQANEFYNLHFSILAKTCSPTPRFTMAYKSFPPEFNTFNTTSSVISGASEYGVACGSGFTPYLGGSTFFTQLNKLDPVLIPDFENCENLEVFTGFTTQTEFIMQIAKGEIPIDPLEAGIDLSLKKFAYLTIESDSVLMSMDTLENFYLTEKESFIGSTDSAQELLNQVRILDAQIELASSTPLNYAEDALKEVLEIQSRLIFEEQLHIDSVDLDRLFIMADYCPIRYGEAVHMARSIINALDEYKSKSWNDDELCIAGITYKMFLGKDDSTQFNPYLFVYPNPSDNLLHVQLQNVKDEFLRLIEIYNLQGQCIMSKSNKNQSIMFDLDVSTLSSGVFLLKARTDKNTYHQNILITHE